MSLLLLLVLFVVAAVVVGLVAASGSPRDGRAEQTALQQSVAKARADQPTGSTSCRMLVAPDYPFSRLAGDVQGLGLSPAAPFTQDEPVQAVWADDRFTITYHHDPSVGLRALEIAGRGEAKHLRNDLLNGAYTPSLEGYKVSKLLESSVPRECLLGILAAEWIGVGADHRYYLAGVDKLRAHPDATVATQAQRVHAVLLAQARG